MIEAVVSSSFGAVKSMLSIFTREPFVYFVAVALVSAIVAVARKFVPMRRS